MQWSNVTKFWCIACVAISMCACIIIIEDRQRAHQIQDALDTRTAELQVADELLQLVFEGKFDRDLINMEEVTVSAYSSRRQETDDTPHETASGENTMVGLCAVSRDLINNGVEFGDVVVLAGVGLFRVEDVMNRRYTKTIDIWCADPKAARLFGRQGGVTMVFMDRRK